MTVNIEDVERLDNVRVVDAKGEKIGNVAGPHVLKGTLVGVKVRLDDALARLPTVARDQLEVAPHFLEVQDDGDVHLLMDFMDAVTNHALPRADHGRGEVTTRDTSPARHGGEPRI